MEIKKEAVCGSLTSNDCLVSIRPCDNGINLSLTSSVMRQFGKQIEKVIRDTLEEMDVKNLEIKVEDKGALDCTIKARVETAVKRAND